MLQVSPWISDCRAEKLQDHAASAFFRRILRCHLIWRNAPWPGGPSFLLDKLKLLGSFKAMGILRLSLYEPGMVFLA